MRGGQNSGSHADEKMAVNPDRDVQATVEERSRGSGCDVEPRVLPGESSGAHHLPRRDVTCHHFHRRLF